MTGSIRIPEGLDEVYNSWEYTSIGGPAIVPQGVKKFTPILAHLQSSVFKLSKDLIDSIHEEGIVAYTS